MNKKLLYEFLSITFAVFLGLMLNQWKDNHNNEKLANQSKINILDEIIDNKATVQDMLNEHKIAKIKLDSTLTILGISNKDDEMNVELNFELISSTSWETAKLTQAIAHMDIDIVTDIASVYDFQHYYESIIKNFVVNNIYNKSENRDAKSLKKIKNLLDAIIPLENSLIENYDQIKTEILNNK